ncbi:hypothetical protein Q3G72_025557 [Acer saccharum]|nr:hypothetical protein Q3G72_025557 [Acer saccharum]
MLPVGLGGIGGLLRNSVGDIVCLFSAPIGVGSALDSEVQAILKACQMCVNVLCPADVNITIEFDSQAAVSCVNGAGEVGNLMIRECILDIKEILLICKPRLSVKAISRESNMAADFLANQGVLSGLVQEAWV